MIHIEVNFSRFCDQFSRMGRADTFSYEGKKVIFDYLEEAGGDIELDVIALCCEYEESDLLEIVENYSLDLRLDYDAESGQTLGEYIDENEDEVTNVVRDFLNDHTSIIGETSSGFVYACF